MAKPTPLPASKPELKEFARQSPDLAEVMEDYQWCIRRRSNSLFGRQKLNNDVRFCQWPGQSDDGRKWSPRKGEREVRPWKGASDSRPMLVDTYIVEDKAKLMTVWRRNKIHVAPTESNDTERATRLTQLLRWLRYTQMKEAAAEAELCANWLLERGSCIMGTFWKRQTQMGYDEIDLETLLTEAQQAQELLQRGLVPPGYTPEQLVAKVVFPPAVRDPAREDEALKLFGARFPDVKPDAARKAVVALRTEGYARFPRPYLKENRPCILALSPNEEIFVPEDAVDLESTRSIYRRELLTEAILRERIVSHGWDEKFVNEVVKTQRGNVANGLGVTGLAGTRLFKRTGGLSILSAGKLFEIVHAYRRLADEEGVLGIWYTCFHAGMTNNSATRQRGQSYAWHGLLNYEHGEMPFTYFQRERISRVLDDSRGYGEILNTHQAQVKGQWDLRLDASSIRTLPPSHHPANEAPEEWGPGVQIETNRPEGYGFFESPSFNPGSKEIEESIRHHADRRMGRRLPDGDNQIAATAMDQDLADKWMEGWQGVDTQSLQLMQQLGPEDIYYRVVGNDQAQALHVKRDEIQGQFDVSISYNMANMDLANLKPVFEFFGEVLAWDIGGRVDRDELIGYAFDAFDPNLAERVLKPAQAASAAEVEDERTHVLPALVSGIGVDVKPGQAWQLRAQTLQQEIQNNPKLRKMYMEDEDFKELVENRLQQLNHQVQQYTVNAQSGRLGDTPAAAAR
jgi:hypothetical protein